MSAAPDRFFATADRRPDEGQAVYYMHSDGTVCPGWYMNRLWWVEDKSMYVYFTPKFWRPRQ